MNYDLTPRNYISGGRVLQHTYEIMLRDHPEAFDCIVFPALGSEHDEVNTVDAPTITLLDRDERRQTYGKPFKARALIVPEKDLIFGITDSDTLESFHNTDNAINILLSVRGVRTFSFIQWQEYTGLDGENIIDRTVYIASSKPIGRTMNVWDIHTCFPLFAEGEKPALPTDSEENTIENNDTVGVLNG